jgi:hypothetical protein
VPGFWMICSTRSDGCLGRHKRGVLQGLTYPMFPVAYEAGAAFRSALASALP